MENKNNIKKPWFFKRWASKITHPNTKIVENSKWFLIAPMILIAVGIIIVSIFNFNLSLSFTGGSLVELHNVSDTNYEQSIETAMDNVGINTSTAQIVKETNTETGVSYISIRYQIVDGVENQELFNNFEAELLKAFPTANVIDKEQITPTASSQILLDAFISIFIAVVAILIYVAIRFKFASGFSAIIALMHDILVMGALVAIFRIQIDESFIAALITIVGYSINDTLVLFDKVRSNERKPEYEKYTTSQVVDISIKQTLARTINTSVTTIIPVVMLVIFGGAAISSFALAILFGLLAGTYSSIFIASPLYVRFTDYRKLKMQQKLGKNSI